MNCELQNISKLWAFSNLSRVHKKRVAYGSYNHLRLGLGQRCHRKLFGMLLVWILIGFSLLTALAYGKKTMSVEGKIHLACGQPNSIVATQNFYLLRLWRINTRSGEIHGGVIRSEYWARNLAIGVFLGCEFRNSEVRSLKMLLQGFQWLAVVKEELNPAILVRMGSSNYLSKITLVCLYLVGFACNVSVNLKHVCCR